MSIDVNNEKLINAGYNNLAIERISEFGKNHHLNANQYSYIIEIMTSSPKLVEQFNYASSHGENYRNSHFIKNLDFTPDDIAVGAIYDADNSTLSINKNELSISTSTKNKFNLIFIVAHETRHALNRDKTLEAKAAIPENLKSQLQSAHGDLNIPFSSYIAWRRKDEAQAQIAGFNAVVSALEKQGIIPTPENIYNSLPEKTASFFIEKEFINNQPTFKFKNGYFPKNAKNTFLDENNLTTLETAAQNYYDIPAPKQGLVLCASTGSKSDYVNIDANLPMTYFLDFDIQKRSKERELDNSQNTRPLYSDKNPLVLPINTVNFKVPKIDNSGYVNLQLEPSLINNNEIRINRNNISQIPYRDDSTNTKGYFQNEACPLNKSDNHISKTNQFFSPSHSENINHAPSTNALARLENLMNKWDRAISAYESGNEAAIRASNQEMLQNPAVERMKQDAAKLHEQDYAQQQAEYERMQQQQQVQSIGGRTR
jgi:hypothetical protein